MKIEKVTAREIYDSRGVPTIACEIQLDSGIVVQSAVPSGMSCGTFEALELRDGGDRLAGLGVTKAVNNLENIIGPELIGKEPDTVDTDVMMLELDGTENKSKFGANAILAASIAVFKAQAAMHNVEQYALAAHLIGAGSVSMPVPMFNVINGGVHADNMLHIQEMMVIPSGTQSYRKCLESAVTLFYCLKGVLHEQGKRLVIGDEGGFAPSFEDDYQALDTLMEAIDRAQQELDVTYAIALDVAASEFYDKKTKSYCWYDDNLNPFEMITLYAQLCSEYPIYSIEDGLREDDWDSWQIMVQQLGENVRLIGDDIFVTNPERIQKGIEQKVAHGAIIKPNQIGTVSEALQSIQLCQDNNMMVVASHRSGETTDTFIADLAAGVSADHIKAGGCSRGERMAKYNRLLAIEDKLMFNLLEE